MVRFARAHGSKSSNERQPEEATSWQDMQQQCFDSIPTPTKAQKISVKDIKDRMNNMEPTNSEWADIEDDPPRKSKKNKKIRNVDNPLEWKKCKKTKKSRMSENGTTMKLETEDKLHKGTKKDKKRLVKEEKRNKKELTKMLKHLTLTQLNETNLKDTCKLVKKERKSSEIVSDLNGVATVSKRQKRIKKKLLQEGKFEKNDDMTISDIANALTLTEPVTDEREDNHTLTKKQKRRMKHLQKKGKDNLGIKKTTSTKLSKRQKRNKKRLTDALDGTGILVPNNKIHKRRKPEVASSIIQVNGEDVEVTMFDGFPVRKQDADRLKELQDQMIANNIPKDEIQLAMKMERRKAEKAWAREKKNVCFLCRKSGHNLSECPELGDSSKMPEMVPSSGICYKCGSTEHTHFDCRVNRTQDYRFAKCFICQEQGHISNQCPDNPRGLYPKGGACKVCGDVTHLKKDCPDLLSKKEEQTVTLSTINSNLELLDEDMNLTVEPPFIKYSKKIVKF